MLASSPWTALESRRGRTSSPRRASSARATSSTSTRRAPVRSPHALEGAAFAVRSVDERPYRRKPAAPFRTATLQQEASRKLRFSAQTTMRVAQRLYENGHITYMRTDSTTLSESALEAARVQVRQLFGDDYVPEKPRQYGRAVANAQEAHEAIRPAGDEFRTPKELASELNRDELALYDLVWKRTLASQMEDARGQTVSLRIGASSSGGRGRGVRRLGHGHHVPRLSGRLRAGKGRTVGRRRGTRAPAPVGGSGGIPCEPRAGRPLDGPACQVHGADARPRARGARHRPPVDLRRDPLHDRRPRLRVQEGHGARSHVRRVRGRQPAGAPLRAARRLRLHRADGGRPRPHRRGRESSSRVARTASTSATGPTPGSITS